VTSVPTNPQLSTALRASLGKGNRSPLLVAPCGSGKTHIARSIIAGAVAKEKQVLFLAPRRELIYQTCEKLDDAGIEYGIYMAGEERKMFSPVQVASIPTLYRRMETVGKTALPIAQLVLIDEAHLSLNATTQAVLAAYPNAVKIGLTATPARSDGKGMGDFYDDLVMGPTVRELTDLGFLVPVKYFGGKKADLSDVKIQMGDYNTKQLGDKMDDVVLIGDVVTNWLRIAGDRKTVVFSVNVKHSIHLCDRFKEVGITAEHIDAKTPNEDRRAILNRVKSGDTQVICNCDILTYGWDAPPISCAVIARPTKSIARYLQAAGRVLRPYDGKEDTIIIDHGGIIEELGFVDEDWPWSLDGNSKVQDRKEVKVRRVAKDITCQECGHVFTGSAICPACGHMSELYGKAVLATDTELAEINRKGRKERVWSMAEKQDFYSELLWWANEKGYKPGWAANQYRQRLGVWPNQLHKRMKGTSHATQSWIRSRQIAYAKMKEKQNASQDKRVA
jgi:DNA repair protein RadD